jgi:hypothetical protein
MNKKTLIAAAISALAFGGIIASAVGANTGGWENVMATDVKSENGAVVKRLAFSKDAVGPVQMGQHVVVGEPVKGPTETRYNLYILRDGMQKVVANVPAYALDANRFAKNGDRLVYANRQDEEGNYWTVLETNLETGEVKTLAKDVFINHASNVEVMVEGEKIYLEAEYGLSGKAYAQAAVLVWENQNAIPITEHWELNREDLEDVQNGVALVKMTFASGYKELWLMDSAIVNYTRGSMKAVPGTWTPPNEDLVAGHFTKDGTIEYFQYFTRHTYKPGAEAPMTFEGQHITWYKPIESAYRLKPVGSDMGMAWIDPEGGFWSSYQGVGTSQGWTRQSEDPNDVLYVITPNNLESRFAFDGYRMIYRDGNSIYERTNLPLNDQLYPIIGNGKDRAVRVIRTQADATVSLIRDGKRYAMPSETVYMSYFRDWSPVEMVSFNELHSYADGGLARFAAGTKVKAQNDAKVYVVGSDGKLHWIQNEDLAFAVYGPTWNRDILEVAPTALFDYQTGGTVLTASDMEKI